MTLVRRMDIVCHGFLNLECSEVELVLFSGGERRQIASFVRFTFNVSGHLAWLVVPMDD